MEWAPLFAESTETLSFQALGKHSLQRAQNPRSLVPRRELKTRISPTSQPYPDSKHIRAKRKARSVENPSIY